MSEQQNLHKMLQEQRLPHQLEIQSRQIESVLLEHDVDGQVASGQVRSGSIRFDLHAHVESGFERLRHIKQDLLQILGTAEGMLTGENGQWRLQVPRSGEPPLALLDLLPELSGLPPLTLLLGLDEDEQPLLLKLEEIDLTHILISGGASAGKTSLLRTIAFSLALTHRQSQLQLLVLDASTNGVFEGYTALEPLSYLPHMQAPVAYDVAEYYELLHFLVDELAYREEQQMKLPPVVLLIDEVVQLLTVCGKTAEETIMRLLQRGPLSGIHLVLTTNSPDSARLKSLLRSNLDLRIVGRVDSPELAAAASGLSNSQADYLLGKGDFVMVVGSEVIRFQSAFIGDHDLHLTLETLHRNRPSPLLAQPLAHAGRLVLSTKRAAQSQQDFTVEDVGVVMTAAGTDEAQSAADEAVVAETGEED